MTVDPANQPRTESKRQQLLAQAVGLLDTRLRPQLFANGGTFEWCGCRRRVTETGKELEHTTVRDRRNGFLQILGLQSTRRLVAPARQLVETSAGAGSFDEPIGCQGLEAVENRVQFRLRVIVVRRPSRILFAGPF